MCQVYQGLQVPVENLERQVHANGGLVVRGILVHVVLDDAGLVYAHISEG